MEENPNAFVIKMELVYNDETNGSFIQTFKFVNVGILLALLHSGKNVITMKNGIDALGTILVKDIFAKYAEI